VRAGLQVPPWLENDFNQAMEQLGYHYIEESDHPAAGLFLT